MKTDKELAEAFKGHVAENLKQLEIAKKLLDRLDDINERLVVLTGMAEIRQRLKTNQECVDLFERLANESHQHAPSGGSNG